MYKQLARSIREYKGVSIKAPIFVSLEVLMECIIPFVIAQLVNQIKAGCSFGTVLQYGAVLLAMAALSLFFGVLAGKYAATASCGFARNLRKDMFYRIQDYSFQNIDKFSTSSLVTRLTTDITNVQMAYMMIVRAAIRCPLMLIFSFTMGFVMGGRMAQIFLRVVKSYVREDYEKKKFAAAAEDVCRDFTQAEKILAFNNPLMQFSLYVVMIFVLSFGSYTIITTRGLALDVGQFSALLTYSFQILSSLMMFSMVFVMITMASESAHRILEVIQEESTLKSPENGLTEVADGSIDFDHVSFRYSEHAERMALTDIDLHIKSGETIGIIGGTGSSKSSLIQLVSRLYDATEGCVKVGGRDVRDYDLEALRNQVAVVLQKNVLFSGTILENLRWGDENATREQCEEVCRAACADEFIRQMPDGYDTFIERGGTNVSGGQKQRLCIARALLKKPKVLILDDSTSAVDTATDARIRQAFQSYIPGTTKLIIAQRISSVQHADRILVLDGGRVNGFGTHEELLKTNEIYRDIYESQSKGGGDFDQPGKEV